MQWIAISMLECLVCGKKSAYSQQRYFVVPGFIMVPNCYFLCEEHKHLNFSFENVYNDDGTRKKIDLEKNIQ